MKQRSTILAIAAGVVVVVLLVVLQRLLGEAPPAPEVGPSPPPVEPAPPVVAVDPGTTAPRSAALPQIAPRKADDPWAGGPSPSLEPGAGTDDKPPPGSPENMTNLHFGKPQLRQQIAAVEPQLVECAQRAANAGHSATGTAALTFIVAMKGDEAVVETTGVDHDETTLEQAALVECMHKTAHAMKFEGLPREAGAISVTRRVGMKDGALVENALVDFSYIR